MTNDPLDIIFSPAQVARVGTANIEYRVRNKNEGVPFYVPKVDTDFLPMLPGEMLTIIARPGHLKTATMMRWARQRATFLQTNGILNRVVVYLTYEQHTEELHSFFVAAECGISVDLMARGQLDEAQLEMVRDYGVRRAAVPLWFMGHSQERRKKRPRIDLESVSASLRRIENWEQDGQRDLKIDMLFVDYLQRIPFVGNQESKIIGTDDNLNRLKDIGLAFSCPLVVGVQARREVDKYNPQIPEMGDGAWCSGIEQISDKIFACVRPIKYVKKLGDMFGKTIVDNENQMLLVCWKQKMGDAPKFWWLTFDPQYNRLNEAEERNYNIQLDDWSV